MPANFFSCVIKYSFSDFSLASFNGTVRLFSVTLLSKSTEENFSVVDTLSIPLREARESFEKEYLISQLKKFSGNISKTAKFVGMERSALHRKLKILGVKDLN